MDEREASGAVQMGRVPRVDWTKVDHVLLDMDGTLLDLAFDNDFWGHQIHAHYAALNKLSYESVVHKFEPLFRSVEGTLSWYSTDHWSEQYNFDLIALSHQYKAQIRWLDHAESFLSDLRDRGIRTTILTNAHPDIVTLKDSVTRIRDCVDSVISSHEIGYAKEHASFWKEAFLLANVTQHDLDNDCVMFFDDSSPVLTAAISAGIRYSVMICAPDSTRPPKMPTTQYAINSFNDIRYHVTADTGR
jgi:putative hydrolase of the HAD superfamily